MNDKTAIQVSVETRNLLKDYCDKHGYKMGAFVERLIKQEIESNKTIYEQKENSTVIR